MAYKTIVAGFSYPVSEAEAKKAQAGKPCKRIEIPKKGTIINTLPDICAKSGLRQKFIEQVGDTAKAVAIEEALEEVA